MPTSLPASDVRDLPPVVQRFCRYARVWTTSDPSSDTFPSTSRQRDLGRQLVNELVQMGVSDAEMDAHGYVYGTLPSLHPTPEVTLGLVAHMDTSPDAPGENVQPHIVPNYDGTVIALPGAPTVTLDPERSPELKRVLGHDLITSDGTTLLGSDDKAGVAIIMQLVEDLIREESDAADRGERPAPRPTLRVLFTPDEEIGRGTDKLDLTRFGADVAYTLDGSGADNLNVETFNAAEARVTIAGVGVHPGYAKGVMVNALRVAAEFIRQLGTEASPEQTEGREGYLHPHTLTGGVEQAELRILLRDFTDEGMEQKRQRVRTLSAQLASAYPGATVDVDIVESYRNMRSYIESVDPRAITLAYAAAERMGIELAEVPIRGGTDGARLSERGLPCPNVFTGGHDFHSRFEWNTVQNMERVLAYTKALVETWGTDGA